MKVEWMTSPSGKKQPGPHYQNLSSERAADLLISSEEAGGEALRDGVAPSPHLESILGKIHSIMAEVPPLPASDAGETPGEQSQMRLQTRLNEKTPEDKFEASEPLDLLAPYSEVLNDVRDYFKDRHSLDPSSRLSEDVLPPLAGAHSQADEGQFHQVSAERKERGFLSGESSSSELVKDENSSRGIHVAGQAETSEEAQPLEASRYESNQQIFSPLKFDSPLSKQAPLQNAQPDIMVSGHEEVQIFRRELMGRISQLEQVIGHHFGTQKSIAADAARAAVDLTLKSLDETPIGRRLAALESALAAMQAEQTQKKQHNPQDVTPQLMQGELALGDQEDIETREKPGGAVLPPLPQADERPGIKVDEAGDGLGRGSLVADSHGLAGSDAGLGEADLIGQNGHAVDRPGEVVSARAHSDRAAFEDGVEPPVAPRSDVEPQKEGALETSEDDEALAMRKLRAMFRAEANTRLFGAKPESATDDVVFPDRSGRIEGQLAGVESTEEPAIDPIAAKSAALRAQFQASRFVTHDNDLGAMPVRGARPMIVIITVALMLAAIGIFFSQGSFSHVAGLRSLLNGFSGDGQQHDPSKVVKDKGKVDKSKSQADIKDQSFHADDPSFTGNIEKRGNRKFARRLSEPVHDKDGKAITPESLLPMATGKLTLPPAAIGPFSLRHSAANGDLEAQFEVARRFALGQGVERNYEEAVRWYSQAAAKGFAPAQYRLGTFYERGRGVVRSLEAARTWYQRAAKLGNVKAMHNLAVINTALNRENPDYAASIYWFKQAANYNLADSQFNLAILYQNGVGVQKNQVEAYRWFSLAARQGDLEAAKRRDIIEKKLKKSDLLLVANMLQAWSPMTVDPKANLVGLKRTHLTSTMSHADETVERSRVLTAQILLRKLGYKIREADGALNEMTVSAIKKFEKDKGMPLTGKVTPELIKRLNKAAL